MQKVSYKLEAKNLKPVIRSSVAGATIHIPIGLYLAIDALKRNVYNFEDHQAVRTGVRFARVTDKIFFNKVHEDFLYNLDVELGKRPPALEELQWFTCIHETQLAKMTEAEYFFILDVVLKDYING